MSRTTTTRTSTGLVDDPPARHTGPPAGSPATRRRLRGWLWCLLAAVLGVVIGVTTSVVIAYVRLAGNVRHTAVDAKTLGVRPVKAAKAVNVLVVGSDQRDGANAKYGHGAAGERTDTIILAHLSEKRDNAVLVSFPRDSLVQLPDCPAAAGLPGQRAHVGMINESFNFGGISCTWKTIESLTGLHIDHFAKVDFTGFKGMIDAIGGVEVCLPEPIDDAKAKLHLPAGRQTLGGEQALGYVRARYSIGDGSDIGRIGRQQMFVAAMMRKVLSGALLTQPVRLFGFLDAATKSVTTDPGLTVGVLRDLAMSARGLTAGHIRFVTTPWRYSVSEPGRVEWVQPLAGRLFHDVAHDLPLGPVKGGERKARAVPRSQLRVRVLNGTTRAGLAHEVAAALRARGYQIAGTGDTARKPRPRTLVRYAPAAEPKVPTLTGDLVAARAVPLSAAGTAAASPPMTLVVGQDWTGLKAGPAHGGPGGGPSGDAAQDIKGFDATKDACSAQG
jgi:LCP family protein required for cell wall assembly